MTPYVVSTFSLTHNGDGTASVPVNATTTTTFTAQNLGGASVTATFVVTACSGALKPSSCTVSPSSATLAPNASTTVTATFIGGAAAGSGTLTVAAKQGITTLATSSVAVTVTAAPGGPTVSTNPHRGDVLDVSQCVADCFETTFGYSTPAYVSLDVPRSVTLLYRSGRANPSGRVTLGAIDGNASVTSFRLQLADPNGVNVTFTNGATSLFFAKKSGDTTRLAAEFDAATVATSAGLYTASVTSYAGSTPLGTTAKAVRIIVVNDRASVYGAGVDIVGVQRLFTVAGQSPGVLVTDGTGSASFFAGSCTTSSACSFTSPGGEFSTLTTVVGAYKRTYPDGTVVTFTSAGLDTSVVDRFGTRTRYAWVFNSDAGRTVLSTITDPTGQVTSFTYRNTGNAGGWKLGALAAITTPGGRSANVGVHATTGDLRLVNDADGLPFARLGYDAQHRLVADTNKANGVSSYNYAYGKTLSYVDAPTVVLAGNVSARPRVQVREMYAGLYAAADVDSGTSTTNAIKVPTVDIRAAVTDPRGNSTFYTLGRFGSPTRIDAPLTNPAYITYDTLTGQVTRSISPTGAVTRLSWVADQLRQTIDSSSGTTVNIDYETSYSLPSKIYGSIATQFLTYDKTKTGWPLKESRIGSPTAAPTTYVPDAYGRTVSVTDRQFHSTSTAYETTGLRNSTSVTSPNGQATTFTRDTWGRVLSQSDPYHQTVTDSMDALNRLRWVAGWNGDTTKYRYDSLDHVTAVTDAKGQFYTSQLNALGWPIKQIDPASLGDSTAYDVAGNAVYVRTRQGRQVALEYDALGRITKKIGLGGADTITYGYDVNSRWVAARAVSGGALVSTDTIFTDSIGRTKKEVTYRPGVSPWAVGSTYQSDKPGRVWSILYNGPQYANVYRWIEFWYDSLQRPSQIRLLSGNTVFGYDSDQLRDTAQFPSGMRELWYYTSSHVLSRRSYSVLAVSDSFDRAYRTDSLSRLVERANGSGAKFQTFDYINDRLTYWTKWAQSETPTCRNLDGWGYDCTGSSPSSQGTVSSFYDLVGNPNDASVTLDPGNRLRTYNNVTMLYDADGNMVRRAGTTTDSLVWDDFGQLKAVRQGTTTIASFAYDGFGRRVRKIAGTTTVHYIWDGDQITAEADGSGAITQTYTYYPGIDQLHSVTWGGQTYYASIEPATGDVNGLVNGSTNSVVASYAYTPWGEIESSTQQVAGVNSLRWKGLVWDPETKLYYMRARYYDPRIRRFVSEDPIGLSGGINMYAFADGDPVDNIDPTGAEACRIIFGAEWTDIGPDGKTVVVHAERNKIVCDLKTSVGDLFRSWRDALEMFWDFAHSSGPRLRQFRDGSLQVADLRDTPGVQNLRDLACNKVRNGYAPNVTNFASSFGPIRFLQASLPPNGTQHFVGSYNGEVRAAPMGRMTFTLTNVTSMRSLSYHLLPSWDRSQYVPHIGYVTVPFGNMTQTYSWTETNGVCFQ